MMKIIGQVLLAAALIGAPAIAVAQANGFDAQYARFRPSGNAIDAAHSPMLRRCMNDSGGITVNMRDCSAAEYDRVDVRLNANYRQAMARLSAARQQQLRASQRRWLQVRWQRCDNDPEIDGGTLGLIVRDGCVLNELTRRTLWLAQVR
jgi:uncharacterized protein YecT (DUF1311 family)